MIDRDNQISVKHPHSKILLYSIAVLEQCFSDGMVPAVTNFTKKCIPPPTPRPPSPMGETSFLTPFNAVKWIWMWPADWSVQYSLWGGGLGGWQEAAGQPGAAQPGEPHICGWLVGRRRWRWLLQRTTLKRLPPQAPHQQKAQSGRIDINFPLINLQHILRLNAAHIASAS